MQLSGHGITTSLPAGWEGRIAKRPEPGAPPREAGQTVGAAGAVGERTYPVTHLANFALPEERGDFGSSALPLMGRDHLFICLFEYGPDSVGTALFADQGLPRDLRPEQFSPRALQRVIKGQSGYQHFFTESGRAFCLFVVLGEHGNRTALVPVANQVLSATTIAPR